jgi:hypothetical protein
MQQSKGIPQGFKVVIILDLMTNDNYKSFLNKGKRCLIQFNDEKEIEGFALIDF